MECSVCRHGQTRSGATAVTFHHDRQTIVVTEVPAEACENCGEAYVTEEVTERLLDLAANARAAGVEVVVRPSRTVARREPRVLR
jgi:YgiT-type zinc finger domain-containing protein